MIDTCWFIWNLCIDSRSEACWNDAISTGWPLTWRKNVNAIPMGLINLISGGGVRICKRQAGPTILSINKFIQNQLVKHNSKNPVWRIYPHWLWTPRLGWFSRWLIRIRCGSNDVSGQRSHTTKHIRNFLKQHFPKPEMCPFPVHWKHQRFPKYQPRRKINGEIINGMRWNEIERTE